MTVIEMSPLFLPDTPELRFLPEGPYWLGDSRFSWVAIQHGPVARRGSINVFDTASRRNESFELPGRPGFAFPTTTEGVFVTGVERSVGLFDTQSRAWQPIVSDIDSDVTNTIINDGVLFDGHLIFGCKDLEFKTRKAGLYLLRRGERNVVQLRSDQICSNGKAVTRDANGQLWLYDIDSPTKQIVRYPLDIEGGRLGPVEIVVDLTAGAVFPDGMILTPDGRSVIVSLYDPGDPVAGCSRQYRLADGALEATWTCPGSPQVTCPQLIQHAGRVRLVVTTAVEHMTAERQQRHPAAGALFVGDTPFDSAGDQPRFRIGAPAA
jgi:sugar lactone lactonase YvrE